MDLITFFKKNLTSFVSLQTSTKKTVCVFLLFYQVFYGLAYANTPPVWQYDTLRIGDVSEKIKIEISKPLEVSEPTYSYNFDSKVAVHGDTLAASHGVKNDALIYNTVSVFKKNEFGEYEQSQQIVQPDSQSGTLFGYSIAISEEYLAVGATSCSIYQYRCVYLYKKNTEGDYNFHQKLSSDTEIRENFAISVAIDGDMIAVGTDAEDIGSVYLFKKQNDDFFFQSQELTPELPEINDRFGESIAMQNGTLIIGAPGDDDNQGIVYLYKKDDLGKYNQLQTLISNDHANINYSNNDKMLSFGHSIDIDNDTIVISGYEKVSTTNSRSYGAIYIYTTEVSGHYLQTQKLIQNERVDTESFGYSVIIKNKSIVVGNINTPTGQGYGGAYLFTDSGSGKYAFNQKIESDSIKNGFEPSIASDGTNIIISVPNTVERLYLYKAKEDYTINSSEIEVIESEQALEYGLVVTDLEGDLISFSLTGTEKEFFNVSDAGTLRFISPPDFEKPLDANQDNQYDISIIASDGENEEALSLNVNVIDSPDTDADGIENIQDLDDDNDGVPDVDELSYEATFDYLDYVDLNSNGLPDYFETSNFGETYIRNGVVLDSDNDGISDYLKTFSGTNNAPLWQYDTSEYPIDNLSEVELIAEIERLKRYVSDDFSVEDNFGSTVAVGLNMIVIGAPLDDDIRGSQEGSVYIFIKDADGSYQFNQKLKLTNNNNSYYFGTSVALDGSYLVVGAYKSIGGKNTSGRAYVYKKDDTGQFMQLQKLAASDEIEPFNFGSSVAIDNNIIAVGAYKDDYHGNVRLFKPDETGRFVQFQKIEASDAYSENYFGASVAIENNTLVVGAPLNDSRDLDFYLEAGSVYVFKEDTNGFFQETQKLQRTQPIEEELLGLFVAIKNNQIAAGTTSNTSLFSSNTEGNYEELSVITSSSTDNLTTSVILTNNSLFIGEVSNEGLVPSHDSVYTYINPSHHVAKIKSITIEENTTQVDYHVSASDLNYDTLLYSLKGDDAHLFTFDNNGSLSFISPPDFENPSDKDKDNVYNITLVVEDYISANELTVNVFVEDVADGNYEVNNPPIWENKKILSNVIEVTEQIKQGDFNDESTRHTIVQEGDLLAIRTFYDNAQKQEAYGVVYLYAKNDSGEYVNFQRLTGENRNNILDFGGALAIDDDVLFISERTNRDTSITLQQVFVFEKNNSGQYIQTQVLTSDDTVAGDHYGISLAAENGIVAIGANDSDGNFNNSGSVYIFTKNSIGDYQQTQKLMPTDAGFDGGFGTSLSMEDNLLIIGADGDSSAYLYEKSAVSGEFILSQKLFSHDTVAINSFGFNVIIDNDIIAINAKQIRYDLIESEWITTYTGRVYLYKRNSENEFKQYQVITADTHQAEHNFAYSITLNNGMLALTSAFHNEVNGVVNEVGILYLYKQDESELFIEHDFSLSDEEVLDEIHLSSLILNDGELFSTIDNEPGDFHLFQDALEESPIGKVDEQEKSSSGGAINLLYLWFLILLLYKKYNTVTD